MTRKLVAAALALFALVSCQPKGRAHAERISTRTQLIGGPKALGQIGDYLLENDKIRVIVHGPGPNRGSTLFGGSLLDADLQRPSGKSGAGNDQLGEVFPSFLLAAMEPQSFEVTSDGSDGGPAVVTVEGEAGDLLQMVAVMNLGLLYPPGLRFKSEYRLAAGDRHVEIRTTITNTDDVPHPLPFLDPADLADLISSEGGTIPGLDQLTLSTPMGHLALFGAEQHLFATGSAGFNVRFAIEDSYAQAGGFPAFPGLATDLLATRGPGVSYGIAVPASAQNYANAFKELYPGQDVSERSLVLPFLYSSVSGVFHTNPPPVLLPQQSFTYPMWFVVGRGDVGSVLDEVNRLRGLPTGVFSGKVLDETTGQPIEHASVVVQDAAGRFVSQLDTGEDGGFRGTLEPGAYRYRVVTEVRKTSVSEDFTVDAGRTTSVRVHLAAPGTLQVQVRDELGRRVPSKITLVGEFPTANLGQDPRTFLYDLAAGESQRPTAFQANRSEYIEKTWYLPDGTLRAPVRPGDWFLVASRGLEYDVHIAPIRVESGVTVDRSVALKRGVNTDGWIGADLHLHAQPSLDSEMSLDARVASLAGEGLDYVVSTDHNFITDYLPAIAKLGLQDWLTSTVGLELTTFEMGHFNGYPLKLDPGNVRGGAFKWAGETPDSLFAQLRGLGKYGPAETIVQVNHPRDNVLGYFSQLNMVQETGVAEAKIGLRGVFAPYGDEFAPAAFSLDFDAFEVLNGKRKDIEHTYVVPDPLPAGSPIPSPAPAPGEILRDEYGQIAFPGVIEDWHTLLNRGMRHTGVGASDSHKGVTQEPGFPRTYFYVGAGNDEQGSFDEKDVVKAIRKHRAFATNGPIVDFTVNGERVGSDVVDGDGQAEVRIRVHSSDWIPFNRVILYANGETVLDEAVPAEQQHDWSRVYNLAVTTSDTWAMVEVRGDENLFPVLAPYEFENLNAQKVIDALGSALDLSGLDPYGILRPARTYPATAVAITNPIWIDRAGDGFDAPLPPIPAAAPRPPIDVREVFENLPAVPEAE